MRIYVRGPGVHQLNGAYFEFSVLKFRLTPILFHCSWVKCSPATSQWEKMLQGRSVTKLMNFRRKCIQISRTQAHILWCWVPPKIFFSAEILGKTIESAEVHYTFCNVEFRRTIGLNTKFRRKKIFPAEVRYTICVVEFCRKTRKTKSVKKKCNRFGGTGPQKFRRFFFQQKSGTQFV